MVEMDGMFFSTSSVEVASMICGVCDLDLGT
jgi:hypothetical protein